MLKFKMLYLQAQHGLSFEQSEHLVRDRLSWMRFCGLSIAEPVPDASTLWDFREALIAKGALERLFDRLDRAIKDAGYLPMSGQIVDASLVAAPRQRNTKDEKEAIKAGKSADEIWPDQPAKAAQKDTDAREKLSQQLVTLQDTERKNLAYELHDEIGPCLFGITVDARAIAAKARTLGPVDAAELAERAQAILDIVAHMQEHSRGLLYRLRPMALGEVSLSRLLDDLIERFRQREPQVAWLISLPDELTSCGETVDLTLYRMIQECLTNAARHACATRIEVTLAMLDPPAEGAPGSAKSQLELCVSDNGRGIPVGTPPGLGLTGMSQRVRALGGRFAVMARPGGGTIVRACIPVELLELADLDNMGSPRLDEGLS